MKTVISAAALCLLLIPRPPADSNSPQCATPADGRAIASIAKTWKEGYNAGDAARVAALYSDDANYLTQHYIDGIVHPRSLIQAYVQRGIDARYHIDSIETLSTVCSGDFAYAITRYHSTNGDQKAMGVNLVVMRRIGSRWLIVAHESAVPDPATAIQALTPVEN
jgi:ketosteroid isomerase-like protein